MNTKHSQTITWVAQKLGLSTTRVRQLEAAGKLSVQRLPNGTRLFDPEEVEALARARRAS